MDDKPPPNDDRPGVLPAVAVGLLLRLAWLLAVEIDPVSDSLVYHQFAAGIAEGKGYVYPAGEPTAYWAVGTAAVYALLYRIFGSDPQLIGYFNLLLGATLIALTGAVARRHFGAPAGRAAAWAVALWPALIQYTTLLASELLFATLIMAALHCFGATRRIRLAAFAWSMLLVAAIYVRSAAVPLLLAWPFCHFMGHRNAKLALGLLIAALGLYAALSAPWKARNEALWGRAGVMATNFGPNLWMGNNPDSRGGYMSLPDRPFANEVERDEALRREALAFMAAHPQRYLELCIRRLADSFGRETIGVVWNEKSLKKRLGEQGLMALKLLSTLYWWLMAGLALAGAGWALRDGKLAWHGVLMLTPAIIAAPAILVVSQDRYHLPLDPFVAVFCAYALTRYGQRRALPKAPAGRAAQPVQAAASLRILRITSSTSGSGLASARRSQ